MVFFTKLLKNGRMLRTMFGPYSAYRCQQVYNLVPCYSFFNCSASFGSQFVGGAIVLYSHLSIIFHSSLHT